MKTWRDDTGRRLLPVFGGLALIAVILLLPDLGSAARDDGEVVQAFRGRIESIVQPSSTDDPDELPVPLAKVTLLEGPRAGEVLDAFLTGPGGSQSIAGYRVGDEVVVTIEASPDGQEPFISVADRWRLPAVWALVVLFAAAVIVVGGWHGLRALVALGLTVVVIMKVLLPLLIRGVPPVPLAVVTASAVTIVTILLTEGWKRSSVAAILGTTAALALTGLLAAGATALMAFTYQAGSDLSFLATQGGQGLDLRGVLLASFILGAVGVLDDVTVTQAALIEELGDKGDLHGRALFSSGMGIGRSHIAATVNTLFLAYVGASLPLLVAIAVSTQPTALLLNDEIITTEIVRTLVGSLGIIAAVPLTTFIATTMVSSARGAAGDPEGVHRPTRTIPIMLGIVVGLLVLTAALPLTDGARPALAPDVFDPGSSIPGASAPTAEATSGPGSGASDDPTVIERGEAVPITLDGEPVGTVTVLDWTRAPGDAGADSRMTVDISYEASALFPLAAGTWALVLDDGTEVAFEPIDGGATLDEALEAGASRTVTFAADVPTATTEPVLVYVDEGSGDFIFAIVLD